MVDRRGPRERPSRFPRSGVRVQSATPDARSVKRHAILLLLAAAALGAPVALADPGNGNGSGHGHGQGQGSNQAPTNGATGPSGPVHGQGQGAVHGKRAHPLCRPSVSYILRGTVTSVATGSIQMHVLSGNAHAQVFANQDVTVAVDAGTKIRRNGPAELSSLLAGDRLMVQVRGCKTAGASVALIALRIDAHPAV
jgi:hypothetical protein